jgi:hypothetical protein
VDWVFGTAATLFAAIFTYMLRKVNVKSVPLLAPLPPIICNAVIVGLEIACFTPTNAFSWQAFTWAALGSAILSVGTGELVICYGLGLPLYLALQKTGAARKVFYLSRSK